jgi:pSer/pThr/pTyr-binding forkhead associated (FHA) protein
VDGDPSARPGARLVVSQGERVGWRFPVSDGALLGRGERADVPLTDPAASRRHARLLVSGRRLALEDLGSKNGLAVNGRPANGKAVPLRHGDRIAIGETILIVEQDGGGAPGVAPVSPKAAPAPPPAPAGPPGGGAPRPRDRLTALAAGALLAAAVLCALASLV